MTDVEKIYYQTLPEFLFSPTLKGITDDFCPSQARSADTGFDVKAAVFDAEGNPSSITIQPGERALISLGIKCFIPSGWWLQLNPRSSTFVKLGLVGLVGVIDEMYEGEIKFAVHNMQSTPVTINHGDRAGQLIPYQRHRVKMKFISNEEYDRMSAARENDRGAGGFGSSGK